MWDVQHLPRRGRDKAETSPDPGIIPTLCRMASRRGAVAQGGNRNLDSIPGEEQLDGLAGGLLAVGPLYLRMDSVCSAPLRLCVTSGLA
jgi:hypothetical protein